MKTSLRSEKKPLVFFKKILAPLFTLVLGAAALADGVSIPFAYENHVPFVRVNSTNRNQDPMSFILDTGASMTVVGTAAVGRWKLGYYKLSQPINDSQTATTCGMGNAPSVYIQGLRATCGGLPLKSVALGTDIANFSLSGGRPVDGLLGTDFLRDKMLTINFASRTLRVENAPGVGNGLAGILDNITTEQHDAVLVKVITPSSPRPLVFLVDTGATHCAIDLQTAKQLKLTLSSKCNMNVVGGRKIAYAVDNFSGSLDGKALPSKVFACDLSQVSWSLAHHIDGILGMNFMENYTVQINFHTRQMRLLPNRAVDIGVAAR